MQDAIQHPDRYFSGEAWVLGDQAPPSLDRANLTQQLAGRYVADYLSEWRSFLKQASVVRYRGLPDAGQKLQILSSPQFPAAASWSIRRRTILQFPIRTSQKPSSQRRHWFLQTVLKR